MKSLAFTLLAVMACVLIVAISDFVWISQIENLCEINTTAPVASADSIQIPFKERVRKGIGNPGNETVLVPLDTYLGDATAKKVYYGIKRHKDIARETRLALQTTVKGALIHTTSAEYDDEKISQWATESFNAEYGTDIEIMIAE